MNKIKTIPYILVLSFILSGCNESENSSSTSSEPSEWILREGPPVNTTGKDKDMYLNTELSDIFVKNNGIWTFAGSLKGSSGAKGDKGDKGEKGTVWAAGIQDPDNSILGRDGDFFINTVTNNVFKKEGDSWNKSFLFKGDKGDQGIPGRDGTEWRIGNVSPPPASTVTSREGDFYLDTVTGNVFQRAQGSWTGPLITIKGTNGANGKDGRNWMVGSGSPSVQDGVVNDLYLDGATGEIYVKSVSGWNGPLYSIRGNDGLNGLPGKDGIDGSDGNDGEDGTSWCSSLDIKDPNVESIPGCINNGSGTVGSYFFNEETGDVWKKISETNWNQVFTLAIESRIKKLIDDTLGALWEKINNTPPAGTIISFGGVNCPTGYLKTDGTPLLIADYPKLATALFDSSTGRYVWGSPNADTFFLPDLRGVFLRGTAEGKVTDPDRAARVASNTNGNVGDRTGSYQSDENKSHSHNTWAGAGNGTFGVYGEALSTTPNSPAIRTGPPYVQPQGGNESRPKNANVTYCIKF